MSTAFDKSVSPTFIDGTEGLLAMIEHAGVPLALLDHSFVIVRFNSAFAAASHRSSGELAGHSFFELYPDRETATVLASARETGEPARLRDGTLTPVRDRDGAISGFVASMRDGGGTPDGKVTSFVLGDLIDSAGFQALVDELRKVLPIPLAIIDIKGNVLVKAGWQDVCTLFHRMHPLACRHCLESDTLLSAGTRPGEKRLYRCKNNMWDLATPIFVAGQHVGNVFTGQFFFDDETVDYEVFKEQARQFGFDEARYLEALDAVPRLSRRLVEAGAAFLARLAHVVSQSGLTALTLRRSVAEAEELARSLEASHDRLDRAQRIAHLGSWELDLVKGELTWSDEVYRIFGLEPREFAATYEAFLESVHPEDRAAVHEAYERSLEDASSYEIEHRVVRRKTGEVRWVQEKCEHLRNDAGELVRSLGMVLDVTARVESERALRTANEHLEQVDRRKNEFLAMLAHELRNPLAAISNAYGVLDRSLGEEPSTLRLRGVIARQLRHLSRMVDDLLDLRRIEAGRIALKTEPLDLSAAVELAVSACRPLVEDRRHALSVRVPSEPAWVEADPSRIEQVVSNLLTNAARYTEPGGRIEVSLEAQGDWAVLRVRDDGIGISPELLPQVFEPFVQGDMGLARSRGGLGIGLTLVARLTALHGGSAEARSDGTGQGTELVVRLPLLRAPGAQPKAPAPALPIASALRILVVDDNHDAADTMADLLAMWGHDARIVYGGREALRAAESWTPDLVLLDIGMPDLDGFEVARRLRGLPGFSDTRIVAVTGYGDDAVRERAKQAGFDEHVLKPVHPGVLEAVIVGIQGAGVRPSGG